MLTKICSRAQKSTMSLNTSRYPASPQDAYDPQLVGDALAQLRRVLALGEVEPLQPRSDHRLQGALWIRARRQIGRGEFVAQVADVEAALLGHRLGVRDRRGGLGEQRRHLGG